MKACFSLEPALGLLAVPVSLLSLTLLAFGFWPIFSDADEDAWIHGLATGVAFFGAWFAGNLTRRLLEARKRSRGRDR